VADLLYNSLGAIPHEEYGSICLMPFAVDSDETNALKRQVAVGIANVLESAGVLNQTEASGPPARSIKLQCRMCSTTLLTASVDHNGVANVPAASVIAALGRTQAECPHKTLTLDDQRRLIEEALQGAEKIDES
jgi:hypothetical protein